MASICKCLFSVNDNLIVRREFLAEDQADCEAKAAARALGMPQMFSTYDPVLGIVPTTVVVENACLVEEGC